jgi:multidrug efflux system outer membrane protein
VGLPSDRLRRRPDIRRAESGASAATADIGVATAALYPQISLTAEPGLVSTSLSTLLQWGSRQYTIGAGLLWPIFEGGRLKAQLGQANDRQEQALLAYRKSVLIALQDTEDSLSRYAAERDRREALAQAVNRARAAEGLARDQYRAGLTTYAAVLSAQGALLTAEDQLAASDGALNQDVVSLYKALGGGWSDQDHLEGGA